MSKEHLFIELVLQQIGAPYIWGGKGTHLFDPVKGLVGNPFIGNDYGRPPLLVFDCSGLITYALLRMGIGDYRGQWNAQVMHDRSNPVTQERSPHLRFYGQGPQHITHVAVGLAFIDGKHLVVEASGGDKTVTTPLVAEQRGAKVRCGFERRLDFVDARMILV